MSNVRTIRDQIRSLLGEDLSDEQLSYPFQMVMEELAKTLPDGALVLRALAAHAQSHGHFTLVLTELLSGLDKHVDFCDRASDFEKESDALQNIFKR